MSDTDSGYTVDDATSPPANEGRPIDCWEFMILARIGYLQDSLTVMCLWKSTKLSDESIFLFIVMRWCYKVDMLKLKIAFTVE